MICARTASCIYSKRMLREEAHSRRNTWRGPPVSWGPAWAMSTVCVWEWQIKPARIGQSCTARRDRPLSQLLPDLQLNQHGFSPPLVFFQRQPRTAVALTCHRVAFDEIKLSRGLAPFAPSSGRRINLARCTGLQSRHRQKRTCGSASNYGYVWIVDPPSPQFIAK